MTGRLPRLVLRRLTWVVEAACSRMMRPPACRRGKCGPPVVACSNPPLQRLHFLLPYAQGAFGGGGLPQRAFVSRMFHVGTARGIVRPSV